MEKILIDSGPLIALFDINDGYHAPTVSFIKKNRLPLVTTLASITETLHLLDFNRNAQIDFLEWLAKGALEIHTIESSDFERIRELIVKYKDLPMDFADACLFFLAEKLGISKIATIDRDFSIYRLKNNKKFDVVLR